MRVQSDEEEELEGIFGAAAAAEDKKVSSLHKKCNQLALLPRIVFGEYKNATARRNHSLKKEQKQSAEKLFVRIAKAVKHADSCFLNKKQRKQLTSMCLQLLQPTQQQQGAAAAATGVQAKSAVAAAVAAAEKVTVKDLKAYC